MNIDVNRCEIIEKTCAEKVGGGGATRAARSLLSELVPTQHRRNECHDGGEFGGVGEW